MRRWLKVRLLPEVLKGVNMNLFVACFLVGLILGFCIGILFMVFFTHHFDADDSEEYNDIWKG